MAMSAAVASTAWGTFPAAATSGSGPPLSCAVRAVGRRGPHTQACHSAQSRQGTTRGRDIGASAGVWLIAARSSPRGLARLSFGCSRQQSSKLLFYDV